MFPHSTSPVVHRVVLSILDIVPMNVRMKVVLWQCLKPIMHETKEEEEEEIHYVHTASKGL